MKSIYNFFCSILIWGVSIIILAVPFFIIIVSIVWISFCIEAGQLIGFNQYYTSRDEASVMCLKGDSCVNINNIPKALDYYKSSYETFHTDSLAARILSCEQRLGNTENALSWLNLLESRTGMSEFTSLRKFQILLQGRDTANAISILDEITTTPLELRETSFYHSIIDLCFESDENYTKIENLYLYYAGYLEKLIALNYRIGLAKNNEELFDLGTRLFRLAEDLEDDYEIIKTYQYLTNKPYIYHELDKCIYYTIGIKNVNLKNIANRVSEYKWSIFDKLLIYKHSTEGYDSALKYAQKITMNNTCNTDSYYSYSKFLFGIYLGASNKQVFPTSLTPDEIDEVFRSSFDPKVNKIPYAYLTVGRKPDMLFINSTNATNIEGDRIIDPIIVLNCNEWKYTNDSVSFSTYVKENEGNYKTIKYINNDFVAGISSTNDDKFGLTILHVPSNKFVLNLFQEEYNKQIRLKSDSKVYSEKE